MATAVTHLAISQVEAISWARPVGSPEQPTHGEQIGEPNLAVIVRAEVGGQPILGVGTGREASRRTGDVPRRSWQLLQALAGRLRGWSYQVTDSTGAVPVRLHELIDESIEETPPDATDTGALEPHLGIRAALEQALTQLLACAIDRDPSERAARHEAELDRLRGDVLADASGYLSEPAPAPITFGGMEANTFPELEYLRPLGVNGTKGHLLERQALAFGLSTTRFSKGSFVAHQDGREALNFKWSRSPISSGASLALCTHKEGTRIRLRRHGVPVPEGRMFQHGEFAAARAFAERIGFPVVCKPATGVRGIGVVAGIRDLEELDRAFEEYRSSRLGSDDFIVEQHIFGGDYRIVVVDDQVVAAILREPASVNGDGQRSIAELVLAKNAARRQNPHLWGRLIKIDAAARRQLDKQGFDLHSVPTAGTQVRLSSSCSLSQGGDSIDVLDGMHPTVKDAAVAAVAAIPGLRFCGVDFLLEDHRKPIEEQGSAGICELNAHAAIGNGEYPMFGTPREVARELFVSTARSRSYELPDQPAEHLNLEVTVRGRVTAVGYRAWLAGHAARFGVSGRVENVSSRRVAAILQGPTEAVSALASLMALGPRKALPTSARTEHVDVQPFEGFEVVQ